MGDLLWPRGRGDRAGAQGAVRWRAAGLVVALAAGCARGPDAVDRAGLARWELVPELRVGAEDGPGSLADIRGFVVDSAGRLLVLDFNDQQIHLFDSSRRYAGTLGRKGQGPGEFGNANGLLQAPDGRLWLNDPYNSRFTVLNPDGSLHATHRFQPWGYGFMWAAAFDTGGTLYESIGVRVDTALRMRLQRFPPGAAFVSETLPTHPCDSLAATLPPARDYYQTPGGSYSVPFVPSPLSAFDPTGGWWCSTGRAYEVVQVTFDDHPTGVVVRGTRPTVPVTPAERDTAIARLRRFFEQTGGTNPDFSRIPGTKPPLRALQVDPAGRLWVMPTSPDSGTTWDVFAPDGRQLAVARAPFPVSAYLPLRFRGDRVYAVPTDTDIPTILRARLTQTRLAGSARER